MHPNDSVNERKTFLRHVFVVTLGLFVFLTDNANLTNASYFENSGNKKHKHRLPANIAKPIVDFDCASPKEKLEITTQFEALRVDTKNCAKDTKVENLRLKNKLITFSIGPKKMSSEYTHLAPGENAFVITSGKKTFKVSVYRF